MTISNFTNKLPTDGPPGILIFEGPDCVGKTTTIRGLMSQANESGRELKLVRCPDNRGGAAIRDVIMSQELGTYPMAQMFLFMADFVFAYESIIKPNMHRTDVDFVLDRFLPSTSIYQGLGITYLNQIFEAQFPEFYEAFSKAQYIYLHPIDIDTHIERINKRGNEETNHLDPKGLDAIWRNIDAYSSFYEQHREIGLLGSKRACQVQVR